MRGSASPGPSGLFLRVRRLRWVVAFMNHSLSMPHAMEQLPMKRLVVAWCIVASSLAFAYAPSAEQRADAQALQAASAQLAPRIKQLQERLAGMTTTLDAAEKTRPSGDEMAKVTGDFEQLHRDTEALNAECNALGDKHRALRDAWSGADANCRNGSPSMKANDCAEWRKVEPLFVTRNECERGVEEEGRVASRFRSFEQGWRREQAKRDELAARESGFKQAVSGSPRQRAISLPPSYVRFSEPKPGGADRIIDTVRLFTDAHPSHFVFLRKDLAEAPRNSGESHRRFSRTLKKGEAVLTLRDTGVSGDDVTILSIDGNEGVVRSGELALAPLPGSKPMVLKAEDLNVRDEKGNVIAGPTWLTPDATGFFLDESAGWLDLLVPPEPRTQRFFDAKEKVLGCYDKQMRKLDPSGELRRHYDVVTWGRGGVQKVESAASNFDRKACAACNCKAFNEMKRKLMKDAIAPAQKEAFKAYEPVLEQLKQTDFAGAVKGAPKGDDGWVPQPL